MYVAYDYWAPAANSVTHHVIPGEMFKCHVAVSGKRFCLLFTRPATREIGRRAALRRAAAGLR